MIDFEPSEEQQLIVDTVRAFAADEIRPVARECDESAKLTFGVLARAHELGLVASALPEEHGGGGAHSAVTGALVAEELAWGDLAIALAILSPALVALPIAEFGTPEQKRALLPRYTATSFLSSSLALVEPRFDSDPFRPQARARREASGYELSGRKTLVPWLDGGDTVLVIAAEDGAAQAYLVPRAALASTPERHMGIRALPTVELSLDGVRVPGEARLGGAQGCDARRLVNRGRVALGAMAVGVARAAYEVARGYALERQAFGAPIATKQAIAFKLADMAIEIDGARLLVWEAAAALDAGRDATREATLAIDHARRVSLQVADGAVQVLGGHGYTREYLPEMHLRNARGFAAFEALALV